MIKWGSYVSGRYAYIYCKDIGTIKNYEVHRVEGYETYGIQLNVKTDAFTFEFHLKPASARLNLSLVGAPELNELNKSNIHYWHKGCDEEIALIKRYVRQPRIYENYCITDPRPLRAFILGHYENFKDTHEDEITELLNHSINWSREEAGDWLKNNGFHYNEEYEIITGDPPNANYLYDSSKLIDPYWEPNK